MKSHIILLLLVGFISCQKKQPPKQDTFELPPPSIDDDLKVGDYKLVSKEKKAPTIWFNTSKDFEVLSAKRGITESSSAPDTNDCNGWRIKKENIKKIIQHSDSLSGPDWHHLFAVYPCIMVGQLKQDTNVYDFEINGGAWMYIYCPDTTILLGDFKKEDEKYFISGVWDGK